jgi:hypothetical protein
MPQAGVCPALTQSQQLAAGVLADADEEALLEHLERRQLPNPGCGPFLHAAARGIISLASGYLLPSSRLPSCG